MSPFGQTSSCPFCLLDYCLDHIHSPSHCQHLRSASITARNRTESARRGGQRRASCPRGTSRGKVHWRASVTSHRWQTPIPNFIATCFARTPPQSPWSNGGLVSKRRKKKKIEWPCACNLSILIETCINFLMSVFLQICELKLLKLSNGSWGCF